MTPGTLMLEHALTCVARGWHVFPLKPNAKTPITARGFKDASTDQVKIKAWWSQEPNANIGIATGASGLVVVDGDVKHDDDPVESLMALGMPPETLRVATPSGGFHLYFHSPKGFEIRNSAGKLGPGLDVRAHGGYVVAPPSIVDGKRYAWINGLDEPVAPLPDWLAEVIANASRGSTPSGNATPGQVGDMIPEGLRNSTLASLAGTMRRRGMSPAAIEAALLVENAARCCPPLDEAEVAAIAASVGSYEPAGSIEAGFAQAGKKLAAVLPPEAQMQAVEPAKAKEPLVSCIITGRELAAMPMAPREMLVKGIIPCRSLTMIFAKRGGGKTWFVLTLAVAVGQGIDFLAWEVPKARRVLYVDGEMPLVSLRERLRALIPDMANIPDNIDFLPSETLWLSNEPLNLNAVEHQGRFLALLADLRAKGRTPELIILDNLSSLASGIDENDNSALDGLLRFLIRLRHNGYAVLLVHHAGKGGDQRGASRREDLLDTSIKLVEPAEGEAGPQRGARFHVEFPKVRGERPQPDHLLAELVSEADGRVRWVTDVATAPAWLRAARAIRETAPRNQTELAGELGVSSARISQMIGQLRKNRYVEKTQLKLTALGEAEVSKIWPSLDEFSRGMGGNVGT